MPQKERQSAIDMYLCDLCSGISWANVGQHGVTPVQRAGFATWTLPVKMATDCLCLSASLSLIWYPDNSNCVWWVWS